MHIVVGVVAAVLGVLWFVSTLLLRVTGTWERELTPAERAEGAQPERITIGQLGPLVTGRREVAGGHVEFSGIMIGRTVRLTRRDHGVRALVALGFPEPIAHKLDGEITARLELVATDGVPPLVLEGDFVPQKVEFTHQPPRITRAYFLPPQKRRYKKLADVVAAVDVGVA